MNIQLPMGQLLLQQGNLIPTHQLLQVEQQQQQQQQQQQNFNQQLYFPIQEKLTLDNTDLMKPKRKQVKNACVHCQKACKKCDDGRPCQRCLKYNLADTCRNSIRKERQKGMKRGPYKRTSHRNKENSLLSSSGQTLVSQSNVISQTNNTQTTIFPMPVLPAFVTPVTSPNNNALAEEQTKATSMPYSFDYNHDLMMPFPFNNQNTIASSESHVPKTTTKTTTTISHEDVLDKQQQQQQPVNGVLSYCTPVASPATTTKFRFISQNSDFNLE